MAHNPIIIIPARMSASRFYGKPLEGVGGTPMVVKIMQKAQKLNQWRVVVATPDVIIKETVEAAGGEAVLTSPTCPSGTDRVFEAVNKLDPTKHHDIVVNLQGDLAVFDSKLLTVTTNTLIKHYKSYDIATPCALITKEAERTNPHTVKAVISFTAHNQLVAPEALKGQPEQSPLDPSAALNSAAGARLAKALYFTRSTTPYGDGELYQHFGIYAYKREALEAFVHAPKSALEMRENLEQLRALENNLSIVAALVNSTQILEVNTPEDLERINQNLKI